MMLVPVLRGGDQLPILRRLLAGSFKVRATRVLVRV